MENKYNYNEDYKNVNIKLHKAWDRDVIDYLSDRKIKQTIIKLIRREIKKEREMRNEY